MEQLKNEKTSVLGGGELFESQIMDDYPELIKENKNETNLGLLGSTNDQFYPNNRSEYSKRLNEIDKEMDYELMLQMSTVTDMGNLDFKSEISDIDQIRSTFLYI